MHPHAHGSPPPLRQEIPIYQKPTLQQHDLAAALAVCQAMPPKPCETDRGLVRVDDYLYVGYDHVEIAGNCYRLPDGLGERIDVGIHLVLS